MGDAENSRKGASSVSSLLAALFFGTSVRHRLLVLISLACLVAMASLPYLGIPLAFVLFVAVAHHFLLRFLERPLRALVVLTRRDEALGDAPSDMWRGTDELSRVARAVHGLGARLQQTIQQSREQTSKLEEIFNAIGEGIVVVSPELRVVQINNTVRRWLGFYEDVSGRRLVEVVRSLELMGRVERLAQRLEGGVKDLAPEIIEELHLQGTEPRAVRAKIVVTPIPGGRFGFLVFLFDLTDIYRVQEMRREFFANASHELKTPIAAIRGYAETLADMPGVELSDMGRSFLGVIQRNAGDMAKLIDDMLVVAGLESGALPLAFQSYDVLSGLEKIRETMLPKAREAQVVIEMDVGQGVVRAHVDPQRFESLILNLVDNGIKYNRPGGMVRVSLRADGPDLWLYVEDNGIGIPDSSRRRAFERFYRVDKAHTRLGGGSGLGLAIAKHIVQAHGGTISLRSEVGSGSVFTVHLPGRHLNSY